MLVQKILMEINNFQKIINQNTPLLTFYIEDVIEKIELFNKYYKEHIPNKDSLKKSGVYIFSDSAGEVLYIGKAGANNLAAEIWSKFSSPIINEQSKLPEFINSSMAKYAPNEGLKRKFSH